MSKPNIAIILVNWNGFEYTQSCILSLLNCHYQKYKIIVVDNNSSDLSIEKLKKDFPDVKYIQNKFNIGFTGANNIGIKWALNNDFEYIALLNNDTEVEPDFLDHLLTPFEQDSLIGAVQPLILQYNRRNIVWNGGGQINYNFGRFLNVNKGSNKNHITPIHNIDWITGCCFMLKSEVINKVGLLDEFFFVYFEDADWSIRIKKYGYKLFFQPKSIVYHHEGVSWISSKKNNEGYISPRTHYLNIRNHIYIIKKHKSQFNFLPTFLFQLFKVSAYVMYFTLRGRFFKLKKVFQGVRDGIVSNVNA